MALLQSVNDRSWAEPNAAERAAVAALVALGMDPDRVATVVGAVQCSAESASSALTAEAEAHA